MIAASRQVANCSAATHKIALRLLISPSRIGAVDLVAQSHNALFNHSGALQFFYIRTSRLNMDDTMILMEDRLADVRKECQWAISLLAERALMVAVVRPLFVRAKPLN